MLSGELSPREVNFSSYAAAKAKMILYQMPETVAATLSGDCALD